MCRSVSVFQCQNPKADVGPVISDEIGGKTTACSDSYLEGNQGIIVEASVGDGSDDDHGQFTDYGEGVGVGYIELVGAGHSLLVGGYFPEAHIAEYGVVAVEHYVVAGTAVGEVGHPVAACVVVHVAAAVIGHLSHGKAAGRGVCQDHGVFLAACEGEALLKQDAAQAGSPPYGDGMEAVGDSVVVGDGAEAGISHIVCVVNGDAYREGVGGSI